MLKTTDCVIRVTRLIMKFKKKILLIILILYTHQVFPDDIKQVLLEFPYSSDRVSASARSIIIHYFQNGHYDSVDLVINFCDTLSTINSDWLSGHERIMIEALKGNLPLLRDPAFYKKYLSLCDTAADESLHQVPPFYDMHRQNMPSYDNLSPFLWQNFRQKLIMFKDRYPEDAHLWDFLDIVFDRTDKKVVRYLVNYPESPFSKLVRYNFFVRYEYRYHGVIIGAGTAFLNLDKEINSFFNDRMALLCFIDTYLRGFSINTSFNVSIKRSRDSMLIDNDTIPIATPFRDIFFDITFGPIISVKDLVYITPYIGAGGFHTSPFYEKEISLPIAWGAKAGISTNLRLAFYDTKFITALPKPDLAIRLDMGYQYNKFYRIRGDLGKNVFYINLALELICLKFERIYDVD